ncbi:MAG TPA: polysaccharide biosynthesis/export family protein [Verrucomicrobiae bacterium]|nr:polysaccharide biosynthesis/export family protein [Verrucomicrobiae bacterium]
MKLKTALIKGAASVLVMILAVPYVSAEPLAYRGNDSGTDMNGTSAVVGDYPVASVGYSTNYQTQFSPYASFMSSPYGPMGSPMSAPPTAYQQGQMMPAYAQQPQQGANDPYAANEVSPYSKYSPYVEIIGEGSDYTLGVDDVVTIIVRNQPDFSGRYIVDPNGNIQYNFVGDVKAEGKTKEELKADITERLKEYVRYPDVAVMISEYRSKNIYVFGFVNRPGKFAMKGNKITVKEAIVAAGLPRMDGSLKRVYVIRPSEFRDNDKAAKKKVDLKKLIEKGDSAEDFLLQPGDTLVVHQRYFDRFVNGFSRLVGPLFQAAAVYELGFGSKDGGFISGGKNN